MPGESDRFRLCSLFVILVVIHVMGLLAVTA